MLSDLLLRLAVTVPSDSVGIPKVEATQNNLDIFVNAIFFLAGMIAVIFVVIGGIRYIISEGNSGRVEQSKNAVLYPLVGLVIISAAFAVVQLILGIL